MVAVLGRGTVEELELGYAGTEIQDEEGFDVAPFLLMSLDHVPELDQVHRPALDTVEEQEQDMAVALVEAQERN